MTPLREYLTSQKISQAEFAARMGVSKGYMSELVAGRKAPGLDLAVKIEDETRFSVTVRSWVSRSVTHLDAA